MADFSYLASRRRSSIESINLVEIFAIFLVITTVLAFTYFWIVTIDDPLTIQVLIGFDKTQ